MGGFVIGMVMLYVIAVNILPDPGAGLTACAYSQTGFIDCIAFPADPSWDVTVGSILNGTIGIFLIYISLKGVRHTLSRTVDVLR
jgi:hypothetical protein